MNGVSPPTPSTPREQLFTLIPQLPKAELHLHIEGTLEPELAFHLAHRNGIRLSYSTVEDLRAAFNFKDLQSFLDLYFEMVNVLQTEEDFFDLAWAYFQRAAADNVVRAEIFFDLQPHASRGVPFETVIQGIHRAREKAESTLGISVALILCLGRHLTEESALETIEQALQWRHTFIGVGLGGCEVGNPPEKFSKAFARCRELGLHVMAHAGEEGPPSYIWGALDVLQVQRVDHGVRSVEDPALVRRLAADAIPLTVCPLSNLKLCVVKDLADLPILTLLAAGVKVTINSDDPAYFGGYLNDNWLQTFHAFPQLGATEAYQLAINSLEASFASPEQKATWKSKLETVFQGAQHA